MGTSKSYGGPGDRTPLLPSWAQPLASAVDPGVIPDDPSQQQAPGESTQGSAGMETPTSTDIPGSNDEVPRDSTPAAQSGPPAVPGGALAPWRAAKVSLGKTVSGGSRRDYAAAASGYVRARGGSRQAARSARSGRASVVALGGFLTGVVTRGADATLRALGLGAFVGENVTVAFAAIANVLAPAGASLEEAAARVAIMDVLERFYALLEDGGLQRLESLTQADLRQAIKDSVGAYIYHRWLQELGRQIEVKAISASHAVRLEREVQAYVRALVDLNLATLDPLNVAWDGDEGDLFVEQIYQEAYLMLEVDE